MDAGSRSGPGASAWWASPGGRWSSAARCSACWRRSAAPELDDGCWAWLQALSDAAAVAVANARAFEQAEALRRALELERDYLREEVQDVGRVRRDPRAQRGACGASCRRSTRSRQPIPAVLILGESGTGKELVARAIHQRSRRAAQAARQGQLRIDSARALRERVLRPRARLVHRARSAIASGASSWPTAARSSSTRSARFPLDLQVKLLRVLQEGEFERVGDETTRRVDVRVVAATNRDLSDRRSSEQRFRLDLFYRLGVFPIEMPPLRARRDDIPDLIEHFIRQCCARLHVVDCRAAAAGAGTGAGATTGRATSASCRTWSSAP